MKILLDTHAFIWWVNDDRRVSRQARELISDGSNELLLSAASLWEMILKIHRGKLQFQPGVSIEEQLAVNHVGWIAIEPHHVLGVRNLPAHHRDPFDRLLVAQCKAEGLPLLTVDRVFSEYGVQVLW